MPIKHKPRYICKYKFYKASNCNISPSNRNTKRILLIADILRDKIYEMVVENFVITLMKINGFVPLLKWNVYTFIATSTSIAVLTPLTSGVKCYTSIGEHY